MTNIKNYNKEKAKRWFALLKIFEVLGAFLFTFGIYGLGNLAINSTNKLWKIIYWNFTATTPVGIWGIGIAIIFISFIYLIAICLVGALIYLTVKGYLQLNWHWAKLIAETSEGKKKRIEQTRKKELADDEKCRKKYGGFIAGDIVEIKKCKVGKVYGKIKGEDYEGVRFKEKMVKHIGKTYEVYEIDDDDDLILDYNDEDGNDYCWHRSMLKMKKKRER